GPVSGVVLSCQPALPLEYEMIWPSSLGLAVGKTHASTVMLPVVLKAAGAPRSTKLDVPLNDRPLPTLPEVVQVVFCSVPVRLLPETSAVVVPLPSPKG